MYDRVIGLIPNFSKILFSSHVSRISDIDVLVLILKSPAIWALVVRVHMGFICLNRWLGSLNLFEQVGFYMRSFIITAQISEDPKSIYKRERFDIYLFMPQ